MQIPDVSASGRCPVTNTWTRIRTADWVDTYGARKVLGAGPMYPLGPWPYPRARLFLTWPGTGHHGWGSAKVLWAWQAPLGDVLVRGRRLDGKQLVWFTSANDEQTPTKALRIVARGHAGGLPTHTLVRRPGCYGWQVDGDGFTRVIVFKVSFKQWLG